MTKKQLEKQLFIVEASLNILIIKLKGKNLIDNDDINEMSKQASEYLGKNYGEHVHV